MGQFWYVGSNLGQESGAWVRAPTCTKNLGNKHLHTGESTSAGRRCCRATSSRGVAILCSNQYKVFLPLINSTPSFEILTTPYVCWYCSHSTRLQWALISFRMHPGRLIYHYFQREYDEGAWSNDSTIELGPSSPSCTTVLVEITGDWGPLILILGQFLFWFVPPEAQ